MSTPSPQLPRSVALLLLVPIQLPATVLKFVFEPSRLTPSSSLLTMTLPLPPAPPMTLDCAAGDAHAVSLVGDVGGRVAVRADEIPSHQVLIRSRAVDRDAAVSVPRNDVARADRVQVCPAVDQNAALLESSLLVPGVIRADLVEAQCISGRKSVRDVDPARGVCRDHVVLEDVARRVGDFDPVGIVPQCGGSAWCCVLI